MKSAWKKYEGKKNEVVMSFAEGYKKFLNNAKTEREAVAATLAEAQKKGFKPFSAYKKLKPGDKVYFNNRDKSLVLYVIGKNPMEQGLNILGAHIDSPRIDIKQNPFYEDNGICLMDTHYYGGIKKYQWVANPLSLHGVICKKDGTKVTVAIGEKEDDPVFEITDILIHLAKDQMQKPGSTVVEGEDLNVVVGSIPAASKKKESVEVKKAILALLKKQYGIEEEDFLSAELELVPAGKAKDLGFDRSMVIGYGQDDRICAYTSYKAILDIDTPARTAACILTDKEEIGSVGSTGAQSDFFINTIAEVMNKCDGYSSLALNHVLENSAMLSSDVSAGYDPNYPSCFETKNTAFLGSGISFNKYTGARGKSGSNDAPAEYVAKVRKVMDDAKIYYQFGELGKVDQGGGGTIAYILGNKNMNVIDAGIPVLNMHSQYEASSKVDIYEGYLAYKAFLKNMK